MKPYWGFPVAANTDFNNWKQEGWYNSFTDFQDVLSAGIAPKRVEQYTVLYCYMVCLVQKCSKARIFSNKESLVDKVVCLYFLCSICTCILETRWCCIWSFFFLFLFSAWIWKSHLKLFCGFIFWSGFVVPCSKWRVNIYFVFSGQT